MSNSLTDTIEFRFVTRTLSYDYRVFCNGGEKQFGDTEFAPIRTMGSFSSNEGPCAVLFEDLGKIYLAASSIQRGKKDVAGRPIRFSFCWIIQGNGQAERELAYSSFSHLICNWEEAEKQVRQLITESLQNVGDKMRESIVFDENAFTAWLSAARESAGRSSVNNIGIRFDKCFIEDALFIPNATAWPEPGGVLKWRPDSKGVSCMRKG